MNLSQSFLYLADRIFSLRLTIQVQARNYPIDHSIDLPEGIFQHFWDDIIQWCCYVWK